MTQSVKNNYRNIAVSNSRNFTNGVSTGALAIKIATRRRGSLFL